MTRLDRSGNEIPDPHATINQSMDGWLPIETARKDGTVVLLTADDGGKPFEIWPMQWGHIKRNGLFPGVTGMWMTPDGGFTWNGSPAEGGPTHWRRTGSADRYVRFQD